MYQIRFHKKSQRFLRKLGKKEAVKITKKIELLTGLSHQSNLDIKKLETKHPNGYRLRVGTIRVILEIDNKRKIIYIHDIDFRVNIY
jgi:mRNA-degrading endonuclease RelE of RelBE toxin-antitoxin system